MIRRPKKGGSSGSGCNLSASVVASFRTRTAQICVSAQGQRRYVFLRRIACVVPLAATCGCKVTGHVLQLCVLIRYCHKLLLASHPSCYVILADINHVIVILVHSAAKHLFSCSSSCILSLCVAYTLPEDPKTSFKQAVTGSLGTTQHPKPSPQPLEEPCLEDHGT